MGKKMSLLFVLAFFASGHCLTAAHRIVSADIPPEWQEQAIEPQRPSFFANVANFGAALLFVISSNVLSKRAYTYFFPAAPDQTAAELKVVTQKLADQQRLLEQLLTRIQSACNTPPTTGGTPPQSS